MFLRVFVSYILSFNILISQCFIPSAFAQGLDLPKPGQMVGLSPAVDPVLIKGLKVHPDNPLLFDFIIDSGHSALPSDGEAFKQTSETLIKYFLSALTIPEQDLWVNLSPYEKDRMMAANLGQTQMGQDMLAQDYVLKQLTASLVYPKEGLGKEFWNRVYEEANRQGVIASEATQSINAFNKVWIVADRADVYEGQGSVFVTKAHLKVMLEADYLAANIIARSKATKALMPGTNSSSQSQIATMPAASRDDTNKFFKDIIVPAIEKEVNEGAQFAKLRQMYYSMILASWYKKRLKASLITETYGNQSKVDVTVKANDLNDKAAIFEQYLKAYKKGVFDFIQEDMDPMTHQPTPRKYFAGGLNIDANKAMRSVAFDPIAIVGNISQMSVNISPVDKAMNVASVPQKGTLLLISHSAKGTYLKRPIEALEHEGYKVLVVSNANDALAVAQANEDINIILYDTPQHTSPEALARIADARPAAEFITLNPNFALENPKRLLAKVNATLNPSTAKPASKPVVTALEVAAQQQQQQAEKEEDLFAGDVTSSSLNPNALFGGQWFQPSLPKKADGASSKVYQNGKLALEDPLPADGRRIKIIFIANSMRAAQVQILKRAFRTDKYEIIDATNDANAMALMDTENPDFVVKYDIPYSHDVFKGFPRPANINFIGISMRTDVRSLRSNINLTFSTKKFKDAAMSSDDTPIGANLFDGLQSQRKLAKSILEKQKKKDWQFRMLFMLNQDATEHNEQLKLKMLDALKEAGYKDVIIAEGEEQAREAVIKHDIDMVLSFKQTTKADPLASIAVHRGIKMVMMTPSSEVEDVMTRVKSTVDRIFQMRQRERVGSGGTRYVNKRVLLLFQERTNDRHLETVSEYFRNNGADVKVMRAESQQPDNYRNPWGDDQPIDLMVGLSIRAPIVSKLEEKFYKKINSGKFIQLYSEKNEYWFNDFIIMVDKTLNAQQRRMIFFVNDLKVDQRMDGKARDILVELTKFYDVRVLDNEPSVEHVLVQDDVRQATFVIATRNRLFLSRKTTAEIEDRFNNIYIDLNEKSLGKLEIIDEIHAAVIRQFGLNGVDAAMTSREQRVVLALLPSKFTNNEVMSVYRPLIDAGYVVFMATSEAEAQGYMDRRGKEIGVLLDLTNQEKRPQVAAQFAGPIIAKTLKTEAEQILVAVNNEFHAKEIAEVIANQAMATPKKPVPLTFQFKGAVNSVFGLAGAPTKMPTLPAQQDLFDELDNNEPEALASAPSEEKVYTEEEIEDIRVKPVLAIAIGDVGRDAITRKPLADYLHRRKLNVFYANFEGRNPWAKVEHIMQTQKPRHIVIDIDPDEEYQKDNESVVIELLKYIQGHTAKNNPITIFYKGRFLKEAQELSLYYFDNDKKLYKALAASLYEDKAMTMPGGIDLDAGKLQINADKNSEGISLSVNPQVMVQFKSATFAGLTFNIEKIVPVVNLQQILH